MQQHLIERSRFVQRRVERRHPGFDEAADHRLEHIVLVSEPGVEGPLRDPRALGDRIDAGRAEALRQEQFGRDVEDRVAQPRGLGAGRAPAAAAPFRCLYRLLPSCD